MRGFAPVVLVKFVEAKFFIMIFRDANSCVRGAIVFVIVLAIDSLMILVIDWVYLVVKPVRALWGADCSSVEDMLSEGVGCSLSLLFLPLLGLIRVVIFGCSFVMSKDLLKGSILVLQRGI